jgi:hypothetical protein
MRIAAAFLGPRPIAAAIHSARVRRGAVRPSQRGTNMRIGSFGAGRTRGARATTGV